MPKSETAKYFPPFPWRWEIADQASFNGSFHAYLVDAEGKKVAAVWAERNIKKALCEFIVNAVNEKATSNV